MKARLILIAGLVAGLALIATATTADQPAEELTTTPAVYVGFFSHVTICHHPPGKNGRGAARANTGKVIPESLDLCEDFVPVYCTVEDGDDDLSEAAASAHRDGDEVSAAPFEPTCIPCDAAWAAYFAEIDGHLNNHPNDCVLTDGSPDSACDLLVGVDGGGFCQLGL